MASYECDHKKNNECGKMNCAHLSKDGKGCRHTTNPAYAKDTDTAKAKLGIEEKEIERKEEAVFK